MQQQRCIHFAPSFYCRYYCWKLSYAVELECVMALMEAHINEGILLTRFLWKLFPVSVNLYSLLCTLGQLVIMLHDISSDLFKCQIVKILNNHLK